MNGMAAAIFDAETWKAVPPPFWTVVYFVFGSVIGSFLNVCIHRMPRGESIVRPPSHCPSCRSAIRGWQNIPIFSWLMLGGRCAACGCRISARYVLVEALTGGLFALLWMRHGAANPGAALAFCVFVAGLIVATFIDFEHLIIPDEITLGGAAAGVVLSVVVPSMHGATYVWPSLKASLIGLVLGAGIVFAILELGKLLFGRQRFRLPNETRVVFTETDVHLPDQSIPYEEAFCRDSDALTFHASRLELPDRCYRHVTVQLRLRVNELRIGEERVDPSQIPWMEAVTEQVTVPREAMGWGDVKFMAAIGAFTGWSGALFALLGSSVVGLVVNVALITAGKRRWTAQIPYGPYLAVAALAWVLGGREWFKAWFLARPM